LTETTGAVDASVSGPPAPNGRRKDTAMNRREVMLAGVGVVALGAVRRAEAAEPAVPPGLISAAFACIQLGQACQQHCLTMLSKGDTSLAECAATIAAMLPACEALAELAVQGSPRLKQMAVVCALLCRDCEKACRKHDVHAICKQCADSCVACAAQCDKVPA
jgi:Cys-rich four helix bundle protein (predicted Tat secretion target)